jgi:excisionase family DNA binding protein
MTPPREEAVRAAVDALVAALLAAVAGAAPVAGAPDRLLSVDEAAAALGVGRSRLYDEIAAARVRSVKVGRRRLIPASAIADYIKVGNAPKAAA